MSKASKLIIFTYTYPYGFGEEWKYNEFNVLAEHFEHIILQPYTYGNKTSVRNDLPSNITLNEPLIVEPHTSLQLLIKGIFNNAPISFALQDLYDRRLFTKLKNLKFWLNSTLTARHLASHAFIKKLITTKFPDTVLYFYWGTGPALIIPTLNPNNFHKIVAKFHRTDLYEEQNNNYLPFRNSIFNKLSYALFISEQGLNYAIDKYKIKNGKVFRLGVNAKGLSRYSEDNILRVITCSTATPVKRIPLFLQALRFLRIPIIWTHIGDGPLLPSLQQAATSLPDNVKSDFLGFVPAQQVQTLYANNIVDLFVNVSESEGVPVSIMEALSAGIPVIATDVGGTHEIVNSTNGKLISANVNPQELAEEINTFYHLTLPQKLKLREGALWMFEEKSNAKRVFTELAMFLVHE